MIYFFLFSMIYNNFNYWQASMTKQTWSTSSAQAQNLISSKQLSGCDNKLISTMKLKPKTGKFWPCATESKRFPSTIIQFTYLTSTTCTWCDCRRKTSRCQAPQPGCPNRRLNRDRWRRRYLFHRSWRAVPPVCRSAGAETAVPRCLRHQLRGRWGSRRNIRARGVLVLPITKVIHHHQNKIF